MRISSICFKKVFFIKAKAVAVHSSEFANSVFQRYESKTTGIFCSKYLSCPSIFVIRKSARSGKCKRQIKNPQKHVSVIQIYSNVGPLNRVAVVSLPASLFVTNLLRDAISSFITDQWD